MTLAAETKIDSIENIPAALALYQRPAVAGVRSTLGTMTEHLSRGKHLICPTYATVFASPSAEAFSFNSDGACPHCSGTGIVREVDDTKLVPDLSRTLAEGAVESWNMSGISWMYRVAGELR